VAIAGSFRVLIAVLANQRDEFPSLQSIDLQLPPRSIREQHIALPGIKSGARCSAEFRPS